MEKWELNLTYIQAFVSTFMNFGTYKYISLGSSRIYVWVCLSVNEDAPSLEFVVLSKSTTSITTISSSSLLLFFLFVWNTWSFTSTPCRGLRDVMPRWKNKYFVLLPLRKTNRIAIFQIHFHCLFQFYHTMQGTKYLAGCRIHWSPCTDFQLLKIVVFEVFGLLECVHSVDWW